MVSRIVNMTELLALPWDADFDGVPVVVCPMAGMRQRLVENAGRAFKDKFEKCSKAEQSTEASDSEQTAGDSGDGGVDEPKKKQSKTQEAKGTWGQLKISDAVKGHNLYELIGVEEDASQDEIKKQYRKKALEMHPDKQQNTGLSKEELDLRFVRVQDAYELLSDPMQRKKYDSTLEFDDTVPKFNAETDEFFEVFEPAFKKFGRWSAKKPVPTIGDADTALENVKKFYDFWHKFESWRDALELAVLADNDEEIMDLEDAECREERRWMERENAKVARKYKQAEKENIALLVRRAENNDPRILAEKEAKRAARQAEKDAKAAAIRAVQEAKEAELRAKEAEELRIAEEKEAKRREEKEKRDAEKAELKKQRQRLRQAASAGCPEQHCAAQLQQICLLVDRDTIVKVADDLEAAKTNVDKSTEVLHAFIRSQGLEPIIPEPEESEVEVELTEEEKEKERIREEKRQKQEAERLAKEAEEAKIKAERDAIKAEEQRKKNAKKQAERERADVKRRQAEKKEAERIAKAEEAEKKAKKEAELAALAKAAAAREAEAAKRLAAMEEDIQEKLGEAFEAELSVKVEELEGATKESILEQLACTVADSSEFRGILFELRRSASAANEEAMESLLDRVLFAASRCGSSELDVGVTPPALKIGSFVRNKAKKIRVTLRLAAKELVTSTEPKAAKSAVKDEVLKKVLQGTADLQQLMLPKIDTSKVTKKVEVVEEVKEEAPKKGKKGKVAKKEDENLDDIFAEFGITIDSKKKKNKKKN